MASVVQFYGVETVLKAFDAREIQVWAIFQGRDMCAAGSGKEALEEYLDLLANNIATPVYSLKVYKSVADPDELTDKTPCNGSFKFMLDADGQPAGGRSGGNYHLIKENIELKAQLAGTKDEKVDFIGAINNLINDPPALVQVIAGLKSLFSGSGGVVQAVGTSSVRPAYESQALPAMENETLESKIERMQQAINVLEQNDPALVSHLEKLAKLSETNKPLFSMLLANLDSMVK